MQGMRLSQHSNNNNPGFLNGVVFPKMGPSLNLTTEDGKYTMSNADIVNLIEVSTEYVSVQLTLGMDLKFQFGITPHW